MSSVPKKPMWKSRPEAMVQTIVLTVLGLLIAGTLVLVPLANIGGHFPQFVLPLIGGMVLILVLWSLDERLVWVEVTDDHITARTMLRVRHLPASRIRSVEIRRFSGAYSMITVRSMSVVSLSISERSLLCEPGEVSRAVRRLIPE